MTMNPKARLASPAATLSLLFIAAAGVLTIPARLTAQSAQAAAQTNVAAELKNPIDSRKAEVGQQVMATTTEKAMAQGKALPRGTALLGHVTSVTQHAQSKGDGSVGMLFDQARLKDGTTVPIHSSLRSIAPSAQAESQADASANTPAGPVRAGGNASARGGGGGLLGGAVGGVTNGVGTVASGVGNATRSTVSGVTQTTGTLAKGLVAGVSSVPGVALGTSTDASTSGVVSSPGRDVRLDSGTQLTLGISVQ